MDDPTTDRTADRTARRSIVLTGASRGIGAAVLDALLERRAGRAPVEVVCVARPGPGADRLADRDGVRVITADLADPASLAAVAGWPERVDALIHSAGVLHRAAVADAALATWTDQLTVNLVAPAELTRLLVPALRAAGGTVVFVNSGQGTQAAAHSAGYAASKHGLKALADALRAEEPALRVVSVYPGRTDTDMQQELRAAEGGAYEAERYLDPRAVAATILHTLDAPDNAVHSDVRFRPR